MSKVILVTGATDGIGKMTALRLAKLGNLVIVHGRDEKKVSAAMAEIQLAVKDAKLESSVFDLSSLDSVKSGAEDLKKRFPKIDVLLNNAGTYQLERRVSKDGFELTMAINHLGPTLLTLLLKPALLAAKNARVIFVSSIAHNRGSLEAKDYNYEKGFNAYGAYATSKLANIIVTKKLATEWSVDNIPVYTLHPGVITTKLLKLGFGRDGDSVEQGSNTSVYLAAETLDQKFNGEYFSDCKIAAISSQARHPAIAKEFWEWTLKSLKGFL